MHLARTIAKMKTRSNISDADFGLGSTKRAAAINHGALAVAVLSALLLIAARPAQAQTEEVLYSFCSQPSCSDGGNPFANLTSNGGNVYGTTVYGGESGYGTVFELSPNGTGGWNESVLYSFCSAPGCTDGEYPYGNVIFDSLGNLYGTTYSGGANGVGTVFELSPVGASWTEAVLYSCTPTNCPSGDGPAAGLIFDPQGNLYGTTSPGYVFELSPSGGGWTAQTIYQDSATGCGFNGGLALYDGNIFGASGCAVFELSPNGSAGWIPTVLHTFAGGPKDGSQALGTPVLDNAGNIYGTTYAGGTYEAGTVYKLTPVTTGKKRKYMETVLHSFNDQSGTTDGSYPYAGVVLDASGNIYGTTYGGGKHSYGTVFELAAPVGISKVYKEKILWNFNGTDGGHLYSGVILDGGNLYGTTYSGGANEGGNYGIVFELNPSATATTTTLSSSPNPSTSGEAVTFSAVVAPAPPDGETISFMKGSNVLGTGLLSDGSASFMTSTLPVGASSITAVYAGDLNLDASTSKAVKQVVKE